MVEHLFTINLVIRGYHVYKDGWDTLIIGEVLYCEREIQNYNDPSVLLTLGLCGGSEKCYLHGCLTQRLTDIILFRVETDCQQ